MLSLLLYKQRHLRDEKRRKHLSFFLNVCVHIQYIYIYIYTHTRVCPVTLASTLSVPGAAPRPPSLFVRPRRAVSTLRRRGAVRRYSKLFTPAEYHFIYARARMRDACGAASTGCHSSFRTRRATVRTRGRPSFLWSASQSRFDDAGRQSHTTQLPAPAMTTAAAKVFLLFFFLGDFLFQRLDDIFEFRESSSFPVVSAIVSSSHSTRK